MQNQNTGAASTSLTLKDVKAAQQAELERLLAAETAAGKGPDPAALEKEKEIEKATAAGLTPEVYADAAARIRKGEYTLEYAAKGIAEHFNVGVGLPTEELKKILGEDDGDGNVIVIVPKEFKVIHDDRREQKIRKGVQTMSRKLAEHWYVVANGVKIFDQNADAPPAPGADK